MKLIAFKIILNGLEGLALLLMIVFFSITGLDLVDVDSILPQGIQVVLFIIMGIGGLSLLFKGIGQMSKLQRRKDKPKRLNTWLIILILLFSLFLFYIPLRVTDNWGERIFMYFLFSFLLLGGILSQFFEIKEKSK